MTCGIIFRVTGQNYIDGDGNIAATGMSVHVFDTFLIRALTQLHKSKGMSTGGSTNDAVSRLYQNCVMQARVKS
jgi:hypothetical protein